MALNKTSEFLKFMITGGLGTITNLIFFFICIDVFKLPEIPIVIGGFLIAATQNYIINHKWSFKEYTNETGLSLKKWFEFISGSLLGLVVNIIVMSFLLKHYTLPYKVIAQGCGIAAGMVFNFGVSKLFVFRKKGVRV
jgi:putative flippase GtrA